MCYGDKVLGNLGGVYAVHIVACAVSHDVNIFILLESYQFYSICRCDMTFIFLFVLKRHCSYLFHCHSLNHSIEDSLWKGINYILK